MLPGQQSGGHDFSRIDAYHVNNIDSLGMDRRQVTFHISGSQLCVRSKLVELSPHF